MERDVLATARPAPNGPATRIGDLTRRIGDDLGLLLGDHVELARLELKESFRRTAGQAVAVLLTGIVALLGLALLCGTLVAAPASVLPALWLRMLLASALYLLLGATLAAALVRRMRRQHA